MLLLNNDFVMNASPRKKTAVSCCGVHLYYILLLWDKTIACDRFSLVFVECTQKLRSQDISDKKIHFKRREKCVVGVERLPRTS